MEVLNHPIAYSTHVEYEDLTPALITTSNYELYLGRDLLAQ